MSGRTVTAALAAFALLLAGAPAASAATAPEVVGFGPTGGCVDAPLRIDFATAPQLGTSGVIAVHAADGAIVDRIDLADPASFQENVGDAVSDEGVPHLFNYYPVIITGDSASIYLHHELGYGQRYYVTVDASVFPGFAGISQPWQWTVRTKRAAPRAGANRLTVAADGSGDFCTVQAAIDFVPEGNTRPVLIDVRPGVYTEIDYVRADRADITVRGAGAADTVIQYPNNDKLNGDEALNNTDPANICPRRVLPTPDLTNCWRALFGVDAPGFTLENLTLHNTTPYGGSQAEAFRGNNQHITLNRVNLLSFQDTLRLQGTGFVTNSYIEGDVDFVWGTGAVYVRDTELKAMHAGYYTQIRDDASTAGDIFVDDRLTAAPTVAAGSVYLGRIQLSRFPYSQAEYLDDAMGPQVNPAGWLLLDESCADAADLRWGEYESTDLAGNPVDTSGRLACSSQLTAAQAAVLRDPANVLAGWVPTTVNAGPVAGGRVAVDWSAPVGHSARDRVLVYRVGSPVPVGVATVGSPATTGTLSVALPRWPGRYVLGYLPAGQRFPVADSGVVTVN